MAKRELTAEDRERLKANLAKGRETAAANRAAKAVAPAEPEPAPIVMPPLVYEGDTPTPTYEEPADEPEVEAEDDFTRFLMAQDAETRELLTDIELRVIYEQETKRAADERKAAARKGALARAQRHARMVAGLIPAEAAAAAARLDRLNQKVTWTVNMPEAGNSGTLTDIGLRIEGNLYYHGQQVTTTLAVYESCREIMWRGHQAELDFQGKSKLSRLRQTAIGALNMQGAHL